MARTRQQSKQVTEKVPGPEVGIKKKNGRKKKAKKSVKKPTPKKIAKRKIGSDPNKITRKTAKKCLTDELGVEYVLVSKKSAEVQRSSRDPITRRSVRSKGTPEFEGLLGNGDLPVPDECFTRKYVWNIIDSYFEDNRGLQLQAITSFNRFVKETLPSIVQECGKVTVQDTHDNLNKTVHVIELTKIYLEQHVIQHSPDGRIFPLYPHEARSRNLNYSSQLSVDVLHRIKSVDAFGYESVIEESIHNKVEIADIPIMVKSDLCRLHGLSEDELASYYEDPMDPGGYFIINGKEKVIITQERPANNQLFLFKPMCDSLYQYECEIRSTADCNTKKISALWIHIPGNPKSKQTFKDVRKGFKSMRQATNKKKLNYDQIRRSASKQYVKSRPGLIVTIATMRGTIPLLILFKALGFETHEEVWETFLADQKDLDFYEALRHTMENSEAKQIKGREEALHFIGYRSIKEQAERLEIIAHGESILCEEVLPGLGSESFCHRIKGYHIGYMVNRLINAYLGRIPCDDRDHLQNKRFDLAGSMLTSLFKTQIKNLMNEARLAIVRRLNKGLSYDIVKNVIRQKLVTRGIIYSMSSGNWGDKRRGSQGRVGVAQVLNRLTGIATISYLRRINSPVNRLVRMTDPRQVHTTAFGYVCPADTPEGETVGLLKALSVMAEVSTDHHQEPIMKCLESLNYYSIEDHPEKLATHVRIVINFELVGTCSVESVSTFLRALRTCRREYDKCKEIQRQFTSYDNLNDGTEYRGFSNEVSIAYHAEFREIRIRTDAGRAFRPLLVVKDNELVLRRKHLRRLLNPQDSYGWKDLVRDGVVEFLDTAESETAMIAMFPTDLKKKSKMTYVTKTCNRPLSYRVTYTHCEIHPSMILGVCASLIPYPDHNQSPRNTYQSGMAKQAIGVYQTNFYHRCDPEAHILHYPQRPLVTTKTSKFIKYDENPAGINAITAICSYSGYNQEDSVILSKTAVQRGLFRSTFYRTKVEEARKNIGKGDMDETFELPRKGHVVKFRHFNYSKLDNDGLPSAGIEIENDEPLIGKTQRIAGTEEKKPKTKFGKRAPDKSDISIMYRSCMDSKTSYVDSVMLTDSLDGYRMVKVKTRTPRIPQIGDKFASRHGQKGVVGMDFHEVDLPFTKDGIVPDIILNPHAIPSRMTIGHLLETSTAKLSSLTGKISDGTCFTERTSVEEVGKQLQKLGFHKHSLEVMYNGATGRKISSQIFIGPVYYQRLKHMTEDKLHIRSRGPVTELCRQPNVGLQRDGGLRFGEMERDSTISHGAAAFLRERLFTLSDYHVLRICRNCGAFITIHSKLVKNRGGELRCRSCTKISSGVATVEIPYACKLFFQELMSMNIKVVMSPEDDMKDLMPSEKQVPLRPDEVLTTLMKDLNSLLV